MKLKLIVLFIIVFSITVTSYVRASQKGIKMESSHTTPKGSAGIMPEGTRDQPLQATSVIKGLKENSEIVGDVQLLDIGSGVMVVAELKNIPVSGKHGFHIHQKASCDNGGKAAGGHFNPKKVEHGLLMKDGDQKAHIGDMGNVEVDENGEATFTGFLSGVTLEEGETNVNGLAIILHAKEDDFGQPTGNAGSRIGCGLIEMVE